MQTKLCSLLLLVMSMLSQSLPARAQWSRTVLTGKGRFTDTPAPHSLSYFTANPLLRDDADDLCDVCTPESKGQGTAILSTTLRPVGAIARFKVWDLIYSGNTSLWKSILIQTGPDRYKEIYHLQTSGLVQSLSPSRIVRAGNESILATEDSDGGNGGGCWESYWWFDDSAPHPIDFSTLRPTIAAHLPAGAHFSTMCSAIHLDNQSIESWVQASDAKCHACGGLGHVTAHFRLDGARVVPLAISFVSDLVSGPQ